MMSIGVRLIAVVAVLLAAGPVAAQAPVALVEDVQGKPDGVAFMDYVTMGHVIKLGPQDTIVLGYLKSCWRETITGATVTVGFDQSRVQGGNVNREKVACDAGRMQLTAQTASKGGAMCFAKRRRQRNPHHFRCGRNSFLRDSARCHDGEGRPGADRAPRPTRRTPHDQCGLRCTRPALRFRRPQSVAGRRRASIAQPRVRRA